ncbi:MAG: substrate-binding domain-containing protein [Eubacterium sp.]|nr:substrate-binding domain-containing protein [Eubacterium sp.]
MKKRVVALTLAAMMAATLAACGSSGADTAATAASSAASAAASAASEAAEEAAEAVSEAADDAAEAVSETADAASEAASEVAEEAVAAADEATGDAADGESKGVIAYSAYNMAWEYYVTLSAGIKDAAEAAGYEYIEMDEQSDQGVMIQQCTDLLNQNIACLILSPCQPDAITQLRELANSKGIPLICADLGPQDTPDLYDALVGSDNYDGGVKAANYVAEKLADVEGSKKAGMITVDVANTNISRTDAFRDTIEPLGWTVVSELNGKSEPEVAYSDAQNMLTANPDIEVIYCSNDPMAIAAAQAVSDAGLTPGKDVYVIGFDGQSNIFDPIDNGEILATVWQDPYGMGQISVETFLKIRDGEELTYDLPEQKRIYSDLVIIDKDNSAEYRP